MKKLANISRLKARSSAPKGQQSTVIDKHWKVALPSELPWLVGMRVYYSLTPSDPPGLVISRLPIRLFRNRLMSNRVRRIYQSLVSKRRASQRVKNMAAAESDQELGALADAAKGAADRAGSAIDDAMAFLADSNKRIANMESAAKSGRASTGSSAFKAEGNQGINHSIYELRAGRGSDFNE